MRRTGNTWTRGDVENNSPFILRLGLQVPGVKLSDAALVLGANYARLKQNWLGDSPLDAHSCSCGDPGSEPSLDAFSDWYSNCIQVRP